MTITSYIIRISQIHYSSLVPWTKQSWYAGDCQLSRCSYGRKQPSTVYVIQTPACWRKILLQLSECSWSLETRKGRDLKALYWPYHWILLNTNLFAYLCCTILFYFFFSVCKAHSFPFLLFIRITDSNPQNREEKLKVFPFFENIKLLLSL